MLGTTASEFIDKQIDKARKGESREHYSYGVIRDASDLTESDYINLKTLYAIELDANFHLQELAFILTPLLRASVKQGMPEEERQHWIDQFGEKMLQTIAFETKPIDKPDSYGQPDELTGLSELYEQIGYLRGNPLSDEQQADYEMRLAEAQSQLADRAVEAGYTPAVVFVYQGKGNRTALLKSAIIDSFDKHADSFDGFESYQDAIGRCLNNQPSFIGSEEDRHENADKRKKLNEKMLLADESVPLVWLADSLNCVSEFGDDKRNMAVQKKFDARFSALPLYDQYQFMGHWVEHLEPAIYAHTAFACMVDTIIKTSHQPELDDEVRDTIEEAATYALQFTGRKEPSYKPLLQALLIVAEDQPVTPGRPAPTSRAAAAAPAVGPGH